MTLEATITPLDRVLSIMPKVGTDYEKVRAVCREAGSRYDEAARREVLPIRLLPELVQASVAHSLRLRSTREAIASVRSEAKRLRDTQDFLARVGSDAELYPYQSDGVGFLWKNPNALLFDEMGLGKTVQALCAILPDGATLVICPNSVKGVWLSECRRWRTDLTPEVLETFRYPEPGELLIINPERLPERPDSCGAPWPATHLIVDEAHMFKNAKSLRTAKFRMLVHRVRKRHGFVWLLTGTPLLNRPPELWSLLTSLDVHKKCYPSFRKFALSMGGIDDGLGHWDWDAKRVDSAAIEAIRPYALRRVRADVLQDLPTKTYRTRYVEAPAEGTELREQMEMVDEDELAITLEEDGEPDPSVSMYRKELAWHKFTRYIEDIEAYEEQDEPVVLFSAHRAPIEELEVRDGWTAIHGGVKQKDRVPRADAFQAGKHRGIACTIETGSLGLTLTHAHHADFIDLDWVPGKNLQAEDRICRIGQTRGCIITRVQCDHPLEERVLQVLSNKIELIGKTTSKLAEKPSTKPRGQLADELDYLANLMEGKSG